jgi:hypothetical protein
MLYKYSAQSLIQVDDIHNNALLEFQGNRRFQAGCLTSKTIRILPVEQADPQVLQSGRTDRRSQAKVYSCQDDSQRLSCCFHLFDFHKDLIGNSGNFAGIGPWSENFGTFVLFNSG